MGGTIGDPSIPGYEPEIFGPKRTYKLIQTNNQENEACGETSAPTDTFTIWQKSFSTDQRAVFHAGRSIRLRCAFRLGRHRYHLFRLTSGQWVEVELQGVSNAQSD